MEIIQRIERQMREQIERTRRFLMSQGHPDLVADLDANLRDVRLGISSARGIWHVLSAPQRKALTFAADRDLVRLWGNRSVFGFRGAAGKAKEVCQFRTLVPLCARGLITADNIIPPRKMQITEHGRFVLAKGRA